MGYTIEILQNCNYFYIILEKVHLKNVEWDDNFQNTLQKLKTLVIVSDVLCARRLSRRVKIVDVM